MSYREYMSHQKPVGKKAEAPPEPIGVGGLVNQKGMGWGKVLAETPSYVLVGFPGVGVKSFHPMIFRKDNLEFVKAEFISTTDLNGAMKKASDFERK